MATSSFTCLDYYCITNEPTPDARLPGTNILLINLALLGGHIEDRRICRALNARLLSRLREIVDKDKTQDLANRIDSVRVDVAEHLSSKMWVAMKGLNPKHLALIGGFTEACYFDPIKRMTTWNRLESLYFGGICSPDITYRVPPFILRTLKALDLHMCLSLDLRGAGGSVPRMTIENLTIDTNDVGTSARTLLTNFPSIKQSLRHITLYTLACGYDNDPERMGIRCILQECTGLTDVKISLRPHHAVQIARFLPASVERVEFIAERTMASLPLLDDWVACAADLTWAPALKYLKFDFDRELELEPGKFSETTIHADEDEQYDEAALNEALLRSLPPGTTITFGDGEVRIGLDDENDSSSSSSSSAVPGQQQDLEEDEFDISGLPSGYDADPDPVSDSDDSLPEDDGESTPAVDLDALPGVGDHPNHDSKRSMHSLYTEHIETQIRLGLMKRPPVVSDEALEEFEAKFVEKKKELFDTLRRLRPSVELV